MSADPERSAGISRRKFVSALAFVAAGAAAASAGAAVVAKATDADQEENGTEPGPVPWPERRRQILRAHEDTVLVGREEG
jgi:nitrous oxide reductase